MQYKLDLKHFWAENDQCFKPFSTQKPRVPVSFWLDDHYILEEMKLPSTARYYNDCSYRMQVNREFNKKTVRYLGKKFCSEQELRIRPTAFEVLMGARLEITEGGTPWYVSSVNGIQDVKRIIEKAQKTDMKKEAFPEGFREAKEQYERLTGEKVVLGGSSRGPATIATSVLGTTNTCLFIMDEPETMDEFFKILAEKLIEYQTALMEETGKETQEGYSISDDNCYLFPPRQYERFCAPVLQKLFEAFAPSPQHLRFQHSDSSMGHLMGILNSLGVNQVNLGPSLDIREIRRAMPHAVIYGQMPPFTLRNGTPEEIIDRVRYDIKNAGQDGGLVECTAGSVAGGTGMQHLITYMWAVETYGRYS